jgi:glycosyltransferase involved in cell wall biosynthesis
MPGRVHVLSFPKNRGKGVILLEGFRYALANIPFDVLVTIDGDRQHRPADIPRLVHECYQNNTDMVIGGRVKGSGAIPLRSCLGNMLTYTFMRFFYPRIPHDTQSGFRAFKKSFLQEVLQSVNGGRYETELIMLLLALERHKRIATVPIPTIYFGNNRSSHFQPVADTLRIYNAFCSFRAQYAANGCMES